MSDLDSKFSSQEKLRQLLPKTIILRTPKMEENKGVLIQRSSISKSDSRTNRREASSVSYAGLPPEEDEDEEEESRSVWSVILQSVVDIFSPIVSAFTSGNLNRRNRSMSFRRQSMRRMSLRVASVRNLTASEPLTWRGVLSAVFNFGKDFIEYIRNIPVELNSRVLMVPEPVYHEI